MVGLAGFDEGLGPFGVIDRVGVVLGFQAHAAALAVMEAALADGIGEIGGVELDAGAIGDHRHAASAVGILQHGGRIAEDLEIVVIAQLQMQRFIVSTQILLQRLGSAEVHGCTRYAAQLAGGDVLGVVGTKEPGGHTQDLIHSQMGIVLAGQVEVGMVGHVENGVLVRYGIIDNVQRLTVQLVGDPDHGMTRQTLVAIGAFQPQGDGLLGAGFYLPHPHIIAVGAAVQVVTVLVGRHDHGFVVQNKRCVADSIGCAANGGAQVGIAVEIFDRGVVAQNNVIHITLSVGHQQGDQGGAQIGDAGGEVTTRYSIDVSDFAIGQCAKNFFHRGKLLSKYGDSAELWVNSCRLLYYISSGISTDSSQLTEFF